LLQAGEHRKAIVLEMKGLADKVESVQEAVALKLGKMSKAFKDKEDGDTVSGTKVDETTKALIEQNKKRGLK
jgi:hypothetical protein